MLRIDGLSLHWLERHRIFSSKRPYMHVKDGARLPQRPEERMKVESD